MSDIMKKVEKFWKETMYPKGLECGSELCTILKKQHPKAQVFKLYRSAVAVEYDEENHGLTIFAVGDPHCMGEEINEKTVSSWTQTYRIWGDRFGPILYEIEFGERNEMQSSEHWKFMQRCEKRRHR
jgi:hypothetical protein